MTHLRSLIAGSSLLFAFAAHAAMPVDAATLPRISNGGTGFIGVTASAGTPSRAPADVHAQAAGTSSFPLRSGEASTFVNGQPNRNPEAPMSGAGTTTVMGGSPAAMAQRSDRGLAARNPSWGTPD